MEHFYNFCYASHVDFIASFAYRCVYYSSNSNPLLIFVCEGGISEHSWWILANDARGFEVKNR
jgi:hypothetical protein